jgi:hypothetical protein
MKRAFSTLNSSQSCAKVIDTYHIRYPEFRTQGYQIGSGTIESGCKRAIGARLKQAGMTWTLEGARQVIKARGMYLSGEWYAFCDQRQPPRRTYSPCVA